MRSTTETTAVPLCVDCDGTLLRTDLLHEGLLRVLKEDPAALIRIPCWLLKGRGHFKSKLAERVSFQDRELPFSEPVLALVRDAKAKGRPLVLATASPRPWAEAVVATHELFDAVIATDGPKNLKGSEKANELSMRYGERGFDYVGNDRSDLAVWQRARRAIVVTANRRLVAEARHVATVEQVVRPERAGITVHLRMIRLHQWLKNLLVWVPLITAHQLGAPDNVVRTAIAFLAFSLCASTVYILNDLFDLDSDRQHARKRFRPIAAGTVSVARALGVAAVLALVTVALTAWLGFSFAAVLSLYFATTLAYSLRLKRQVIVDVLMLAALYTTRIVAGAVATSIKPSFWLLSFSMFIFLSLAIVKRYAEMRIVLTENRQTAAGRGYSVNDLPVLLTLGVSSGMAAVLVLALYINDPATRTLYPTTVALWFALPLMLYWTSRLWMKTHRGEVHEDPVVFAARDWQSLLTAGLLAACFFIASRAWS